MNKQRFQGDQLFFKLKTALQDYVVSPLILSLKKSVQRVKHWSEIFPVDSLDLAPWEHPFLTPANIQSFRQYSEQVWAFAQEEAQRFDAPLHIGFVNNLAQSGHIWARLAQEYGSRVTLLPHPQDKTAINCPEWEEFDGEFPNVMNGEAFLNAYPGIKVSVPCVRVQMEDLGLLSSYWRRDRHTLHRLLSDTPQLRPEALLGYRGFYPHFTWAKSLTKYDVLYTIGPNVAAYASGQPYSLFSFGGDLMIEAGKANEQGLVYGLAANAARFILISNPHTLGHSRRLGLTNGLYLPYPIDDQRYSPGDGQARKEWKARYGGEVFVLMTSRIDRRVKGQDEDFFNVLLDIASRYPEVRFIFMAWGHSMVDLQKKMKGGGSTDKFILLPPVGKRRLIDYYRSSDIVIDQLNMGYYGATGLEAAAHGKPVIMRLRDKQYSSLYRGDVMPAFNVNSPNEVSSAMEALLNNTSLRLDSGQKMRAWLLRNHGHERTIPLLSALLGITARRTPLPEGLINPLRAPLTREEQRYHKSRLVPVLKN